MSITTRESSEDGHATPLPENAKDARTDWWVFGTTAALALGFVGWGIWGRDSLARVSSSALSGVIHVFGWAFVLGSSGFVAFALWLAFSRYGRITLGRDNEDPEHSTVSWIAMMFAAGMGIGLMYYAVSEPLDHYMSPPPGTGVTPGTSAAMQTAMSTTLFHWTLYPWTFYAVAGLAIAYNAHRKGQGLTISGTLLPLIHRPEKPLDPEQKKRREARIVIRLLKVLGKALRALAPLVPLRLRRNASATLKIIDVLAIFATLFGMTTSLGLGAQQIGDGLRRVNHHVGGTTLLIGIITVLTIAVVLSAISGIKKGVETLAKLNTGLAAIVALFVFAVGPTVLVLNLLPTSMADFVRDLPTMAARTSATGGGTTEHWLSTYTIFFWAWWVSWTPFVGLFIAEISRGRTIRGFVAGVIVVPSLISVVWFAIFGGTAIHLQPHADLYQPQDTDAELFGLLHQIPLGSVLPIVVVLLTAIFFISGADAAALMMGSLSRRRAAPDPDRHAPPKRGPDQDKDKDQNKNQGKGKGWRSRYRAWWQHRYVIFWGGLIGVIAAVVLATDMAGHHAESSAGQGALRSLQNFNIVVAAPFLVVMVLMCVALMLDLRRDDLIKRTEKGDEVIEYAVKTGTSHYGDNFEILVIRKQHGSGRS